MKIKLHFCHWSINTHYVGHYTSLYPALFEDPYGPVVITNRLDQY